MYIGTRDAAINLCRVLKERRAFAVTRRGGVVAYFDPIDVDHPFLRYPCEYVGVKALQRSFSRYMRRFEAPAIPLVVTVAGRATWLATRRGTYIYTPALV